MIKFSLEDQYRRYALYEKGHKAYTVTQTISIFQRLSQFSGISNPADLSTSIIRNFLLTQRETKKWSAKTYRIYRQYLKTFFDWCVVEGNLLRNPVLDIAQPKLPQSLPRCLSKEQVLQVMAHVHWYSWHMELERYRNDAIFATFLFTGIRLSELLNLKKQHVYLGNNEIHIIGGKGDKDRIVPILPPLKQALIAYEEARQRLAPPSLWYFPSVKSEKQLTAKNLHSIFRKISEASGVKVTPHMLRHTFGRISVESNINMRVIQTVMGHSRMETTQIYTYVSSKASTEAMQLFDLQL